MLTHFCFIFSLESLGHSLSVGNLSGDCRSLLARSPHFLLISFVHAHASPFSTWPPTALAVKVHRQPLVTVRKQLAKVKGVAGGGGGERRLEPRSIDNIEWGGGYFFFHCVGVELLASRISELFLFRAFYFLKCPSKPPRHIKTKAAPYFWST